MAISPWDPFREAISLRDAMNTLLQESFVRPANGAPDGRPAPLPLDVAETPDAFVIHASLPGVRPEDVHVTIHGDTLTIRGQAQAEEEKSGKHWLLRERLFGSFQRSVSLGAPVNADAATAHHEHGVLTLTVPKAEEAKPKQIKIGTGKGA
jgi:HSP20 family protein